MDIEYFKKKIKNLSSNTINTYIRISKELNEKLFKNEKFDLRKKNKYISYIKNIENENTKSLVVNVFLKYMVIKNKITSKSYEIFKKELDKILKEINKQRISRKEDIPDIDYDKLIDDIYNNYNKKPLDLLILILLEYGRRLDTISNMYYKSNENNLDKNKNYIIQKGKSFKLIFNKYKTFKNYGVQIFNINNKRLLEKLNDYNLFYENDLVYDIKMRQFANNFKKYMKKYGIKNITELRKIKSTDLINKYKNKSINFEELKELSLKDGHNILTKLNNYSKV